MFWAFFRASGNVPVPESPRWSFL